MRAIRRECGETVLWLSARDTAEWAKRPGSAWPCSTLAGHALFVAFDRSGDLLEFAVDGRTTGRVVDNTSSHEFNAITSDFLRAKFGPEHPAIRSL